MKKFMIASMVLSWVLYLLAAPVSEETARQAAQNYFMHATKQEKPSEISEVVGFSYQGILTRYAVNFKGGGFVLMAATDGILPILGFSQQEFWDEERVNSALRSWINNYDAQIYREITEDDPMISAHDVWGQLTNDDLSYYQVFRDSMGPLTSTAWNQGDPYNALCPGGPDWVGCVAVAMGQIMKYHEYPANGMGSHSYGHQVYGTLSSGFYLNNYNWDLMPASLVPDQNDPAAYEVQEILHDAGIAVDMDYDPDGSGSNIEKAYRAFLNNFQYSSELDIKSRTYYEDNDWRDLIISELNSYRPVYYRAEDPGPNGGGHAFVCDGYNEQGLFCFNWGWGGAYNNSYFPINSLTPGSADYSDNHMILIKIKPNDSIKILAPVGEAFDIFAQAVDCNDDYIAISGLVHHGVVNLDTPCVEIFSNSLWDGIDHVGTIYTPDLNDNSFGYDLCIDQDRLVVGAPFINNNGLCSGAAVIYDDFHLPGAEPEQTLQPPVGVYRFGCSVGLDGDYCIVGANVYPSGECNGKAFVYYQDVGGYWAQQQELQPDIQYIDDMFGSKVVLNGSYAVVADPGRPATSNPLSGAVVIFRRDLDVWAIDAVISNPDSVQCENFGFSLDMYGDYLLIGSKKRNTSQNSSKAFLYQRSQDTWHLLQEIGLADGLYEVGGVKLANGAALVSFICLDNQGQPLSHKIQMYEIENGDWNDQGSIGFRNDLTGEFAYVEDIGMSSSLMLFGYCYDAYYETNSGAAYKIQNDIFHDDVINLSISNDDLITDQFGGTLSTDIDNLGLGKMNWVASANQDWIQITAGHNGTNYGQIEIQIPTTDVISRTGLVNITASGGGNNIIGTITITQRHVSMGDDLSIHQIEYFIDGDPGIGLASPIYCSQVNDVTVNASISLSGLSEGLHRLYVRAMNEDGLWGLPQCKPFIVQQTSPQTPLPDITQMEYFIDTEVGTGAGSSVAFGPGTDVTANANVLLADLTDGLHRLYVRAQDANGRWGLPQCKPFIVQPTSPQTPLPDITDIEYFIDSGVDPGAGTGIPIAAGEDITVNGNIALDNLSEGLHRLYLRAKNEHGRWGLPQCKPFIVQQTSPQTPLPTITHLEYFYDADPGIGQGSAIEVLPPLEDVTVYASLPVDQLALGNHRLYVRAKDSLNRWGLPQSMEFQLVVRPDTPPNIAIGYEGGILSISWDPVANITGYKVYASDNPHTGFIDVTNTGSITSATRITWSTSSLNSGCRFFYVKSYNQDGRPEERQPLDLGGDAPDSAK